MSATPGRDRVSSRQLDGEPHRAQVSSPKAPHRATAGGPSYVWLASGLKFRRIRRASTPEIEIELEPIAEGQAELAREIGQLEAEGKRILDIRYPGWATDDLGIIPDAQTGNAGTYGAHRATQYTQPYPGGVAIIVYQD